MKTIRFILMSLGYISISSAILKPVDLIAPKIKKTHIKEVLYNESAYYQYLFNNKVGFSLDVSCFVNNKIALGAFNRQLHVITGMNRIRDGKYPKFSGVNKLSDGSAYIFLLENCLINEYLRKSSHKSFNKTAKDLFDNELSYLMSIK